MKKRISIIIIGIVVIFLLVVDFLQVNQVQKCRQEIALKDSVIQKELVSSFRQDYLSSCMITLVRYDRSRIENVVIIDTTKQQKQLKEVVKNGPVLICRYKESHCPACVDFAMLKIQNMADSFPHNRIVILAQYEENRLFRHYNRQHNPKQLSAFNVGTLNTPIEDVAAPFYCILHEDLSIGDVFIPEKALPDLTTLYLRLEKKKFKP